MKHTVVMGARPISVRHSAPTRSPGSFLDYLLAGIALLVLFPSMVAIALAIKLESRGPIFERQLRRRAGENAVALLRFRTAGRIGGSGRGGDERLTFVGQFLRETRLDGMPVLINVIAGEVSLVAGLARPEEEIADAEARTS